MSSCMTTPGFVKQFIRNVRAAKTIADERAVIQKESAAIRASFREESADHGIRRHGLSAAPFGILGLRKWNRRNNVAKLLYLFTLGERTHFGQIECLKLLASPRFADKRLGHLATSLLLDENQEVLTLVTNSLKKYLLSQHRSAFEASSRQLTRSGSDLGHSNQYIVGLALCTLGNIASIEMSRDLFPEIETLVSTSNPYIRRKAALCAMRICRKVPDLQEHFLEKATHLLADRNHGVLLCGLTLVTSLCEADEEEGGEEGILEKFRVFVPGLVKTLKGLSTSGYAPEHDVTGITDPFVQVKILRLLRVLAVGDAETSEQINDILAQVATNTDSSKNVGNSILYEAVRTILDIEADSGLRVLGVNILGKFLTNRDNNIRYVALNTLIKVVAIEPNAVQRHRNTILECLRDPDISIRRRALDLSFTLINESNVRVLIRELLAFLEVADNEFKPTMTSQIGIAADKYAPNKRWHFDTMLRVMSLAGNYVKEQILSSFVRLIATTPELQTYAVQKLYTNLKKDITQESLTQAGAWCVGEFADALLKGGQYEETELVQEVQESEIVDLFGLILNSSYAAQVTTEYIVTALMKLTTRLSDASQVERVRRTLQTYQTSLDVEVQQRAVEYSNLFSFDQIRRGVLEKMPPPQIKEESRVLGRAPTKKAKAANRKSKVIKPTEQDLLDIMDAPAAAPGNGSQASNSDLLADILGGGSSGSTSPPPQQSNTSSIMDLFGPGSGQSTSSPAPPTSGLNLMGSAASPPQQQSQSTPAPAGIPCYDANGLNVTFQVQRNVEGIIQATARFQNTSGSVSLSNVGLQAAVPKTQKLQLLSVSSSELAPGATATQMMRVSGCKGVSYSVDSARRTLLWCCFLTLLTAASTSPENWLHECQRRTGDGSGELDGAVVKEGVPSWLHAGTGFVLEHAATEKCVKGYKEVDGMLEYSSCSTVDPCDGQGACPEDLVEQPTFPSDCPSVVSTTTHRVIKNHGHLSSYMNAARLLKRAGPEELYSLARLGGGGRLFGTSQRYAMTATTREGHLERTAKEPRDSDLYEVRLSRVEQVNERIRLFRLELQHGPVKFLPGQWLDTYVPDVLQPGGFTITSAPSAAAASPDVQEQPPPYLELAVQECPDNAVASWLWRPSSRIVGSTLRVRIGGSFVFPPLPLPQWPSRSRLDGIRRVVFVAGGVGVNPLVSMLSYIGETPGLGGGDVEVRVLYTTKMPRGGRLGDVLFLERIARLFGEGRVMGTLRLHATQGDGGEREMPAGGIHQVCGAEVGVCAGRLSGDELRDAIVHAASLVYICGPPAMTDELVATLTASGPAGEPMVDPGNVMTERWW
ncbi:AP-1 complex subunit gamma-1 [Tolypocladium paradoxum]|uniref:Gamma-adaptin n=1 Tax=Tolypocladium paradoxum TaxID=94208 RepID=A0A2S4KTB8_9HYPO|nr:AP-1 complex subunit gamma-1 [Tolypocladium paradoxum]